MTVAASILGCLLIVGVLWEAFETIVLPRRITRRFRLTRFFYRWTWFGWSATARWIKPGKRKDTYLSLYGPASLLLLLVVWALSLILGFGLLHWAAGSAPAGNQDFLSDLYLSGTTFITLGIGDVVPRTVAGRILTVLEAGTGFGFLAIVIGYLPVIYQAFSRREARISLLDARSGSPPTATELLRRHGEGQSLRELDSLLRDWEGWSAELLESHLSYPVLCYYRSQHINESWLGALTTVLDTCALVIAGIDGLPEWQARMTFAIARHAVVDISQIFGTPPSWPRDNRLSSSDLAKMRERLAAAGVRIGCNQACERKLNELREMYEPYVNSLAQFLMLDLPPWIAVALKKDNWQTSAWKVIH